MQVSHEPTNASCPKEDNRNAQFLTSLERKAHAVIRNNTSDRRNIRRSRIVEFREEVHKRGQAIMLGGVAERRHVLGGVGIFRRGESVRNSLKPERRKAEERVRASVFKETVVIVLCVNKCDVEAFLVKKFC